MTTGSQFPCNTALLETMAIWRKVLFLQTLEARERLPKEREETRRQPGQRQHSLQEPTASYLNGWEKAESGPSTTSRGSHKTDSTSTLREHTDTLTLTLSGTRPL